MIRAPLLLVAVGATFASHVAGAQCTPGGPANPVAVKRAIVGTVMDTAHQVLENVTVGIKNPRRQARTNTQGRFDLSDLDSGTYEISVYRIGYEMAVQSYTVSDAGGVARFCLIPEPRALPTMITSVKRPGLTGVVGDSSYQVLPGAEVRASGAGLHVLTDSAGGFYLPLKRGTYPIWVTKQGYERQLLSVTIPGDSGRQIAVWLGSPRRNANTYFAALDSMHDRILWARPNRSALVSSEQIARSAAPLNGILLAAVKAPVRDDCEAIIDGGPFTLPLYMIDKADVLMMEAYISGPPRTAPTSINPQGTSPSRAAGSGTPRCGTIYVWMKP